MTKQRHHSQLKDQENSFERTNNKTDIFQSTRPQVQKGGYKKLKVSTGGPVVKNSPVSTGGTGPISGPGRFHTPQGSSAWAPQEKPPRQEAQTTTGEQPSTAATRESPQTAMKTQHGKKKKMLNEESQPVEMQITVERNQKL